MTSPSDASLRSAIDALLQLGDPSKVSSKDDFGAFERRLRERTMAVEREVLAIHLKAADVDEPEVEIDGVLHRRVLRSSQTYLTAAGEVEVERTLYRPRGSRDGEAVPALDRVIGMVEGHLTPHAAATAVYLVAELTPKGAEALLERIGTMTASKSTLHRLPNAIRERWEENREGFEAALRSTITVPPSAYSVAISLDGVLAPMADGGRAEKRAATEAAGLSPSGPAGYREVGCATLSFCDGKGDMISAIRMARSPEKNKLTLKEMIHAELNAVLDIRPNLKVVKLADGAEDNWTFLSGEVRPGVEVIDFFHAVEHLSAALGAAYGEGSVEARRRLVELRHSLLEEDEGAERVIRALTYLAKKHSRNTEIARAVGYFRKHRHRMSYSALKKLGLPIGSGVVEAACKTLVGQRLKRSGMRWSDDGAQAILTPRGWVQSERFDEAWALVAATYKLEVSTVAQVIPFKGAA
jgi:hypothetical protein